MKTLTLKQFIRKRGSFAKAAAAIGVYPGTLFRWEAGTQHPRGLATRRLKQLGIRT